MAVGNVSGEGAAALRQRGITPAFSGAASDLASNHSKRASWPPLQRLVRPRSRGWQFCFLIDFFVSTKVNEDNSLVIHKVEDFPKIVFNTEGPQGFELAR